MITAAKPIRIMHVMVSITETNGQYNQHCLPLADECEITICAYFASKITPPSSIRVCEGDNSLRGFFRAVKDALSHQPDVIHVHAPTTGVLFLLANILRRSVIAKSVYTVRNSYKSYRLRNRLLMIPVFLAYSRLVMCSQACYESLPWLLRWLARGKTDVVANSVDLDRIDRTVTNVKPAESDGRFEAVAVGRLIDTKNPLTLLRAFHAVANEECELLFIGEGQLRPQVEEAAQRCGRQGQVTTTGLLAREEVFRRLSTADLFVSASRGEGLPVAVLEAMGCGKPVVLSDIPPHREIAQGVDFIPLVDAEDVEGFARELRRFQQMPESERAALGAKCRQLVERRYGLDTMLNNYGRVYARVLEAAHAG